MHQDETIWCNKAKAVVTWPTLDKCKQGLQINSLLLSEWFGNRLQSARSKCHRSFRDPSQIPGLSSQWWQCRLQRRDKSRLNPKAAKFNLLPSCKVPFQVILDKDMSMLTLFPIHKQHIKLTNMTCAEILRSGLRHHSPGSTLLAMAH